MACCLAMAIVIAHWISAWEWSRERLRRLIGRPATATPPPPSTASHTAGSSRRHRIVFVTVVVVEVAVVGTLAIHAMTGGHDHEADRRAQNAHHTEMSSAGAAVGRGMATPINQGG